jgi:hypothetical protein
MSLNVTAVGQPPHTVNILEQLESATYEQVKTTPAAVIAATEDHRRQNSFQILTALLASGDTPTKALPHKVETSFTIEEVQVGLWPWKHTHSKAQVDTTTCAMSNREVINNIHLFAIKPISEGGDRNVVQSISEEFRGGVTMDDVVKNVCYIACKAAQDEDSSSDARGMNQYQRGEMDQTPGDSHGPLPTHPQRNISPQE